MSQYLHPKAPGIIVECLLIVLLIFTPLAFGTVQTWAISVMEFSCLIMAVVWLVGIAASPLPVRFRFPLAVPILLFTGLVFAQMLPHLLGVSVRSRPDSPLMIPATVNLFGTKTAFVKLACYIGLYLSLVNTLTSRKQITRILTAVILVGFGVAFLGLLQRVSGTDKVFWLVKARRGGTRFMAAFINENHFAGYMEMIIPITVAFVLRYLVRMKETAWRSVLASDDLHKAVLFAFLAVIMIVSLALSQSRGGLIGFLGSIFSMAILLLARRFNRRQAWVITILLILSFLMLVWIGLSDLLKTWSTLGDIPGDQSFKRRMEIAADTWRASKDYPVWGSGLGTFQTVFPNYGTLRYRHTASVRDTLTVTLHAENDYAEALLETGWAGAGTLLLGIVLFFRAAIRTYLTRRRRSISMPAMGGAASVFAILVHSFSDFNMRIDANVFLLVTVVAMVANLAGVTSRRSRHDNEELPA